jgi:hypothetical protein
MSVSHPVTGPPRAAPIPSAAVAMPACENEPVIEETSTMTPSGAIAAGSRARKAMMRRPGPATRGNNR